MMKTIIRNAFIVNEGEMFTSDLLISNERIEKIDRNITLNSSQKYHEINAEGLLLIPGMIDDQVHFREPGLTHKGTIQSESKAAIAGGITSFMDMPNTIPNTLTLELLEEKYALASRKSLANYSFFMGISKNNLEESLRTDPESVCGLTDDGLYFDSEEGILANYPEYLEKLFSRSNTLIALHSENDAIIKHNIEQYRKLFGENIPVSFHPKIRSEESCVTTTKGVLEIAKKHDNRLHFFHISTASEAQLFQSNVPVRQKRITSEACIHHLWFSEEDYAKKGAKIKWNPSIKSKDDKDGLLAALSAGRIDIIATDHAPHTISEKSGNYFQSLSGGPLVQHALPVIFELVHQNKITLEQVVEKTSHHVAEIYRIKDRGYIREGYFADLVLVDLNRKWKVGKNNILSKCGWSPFDKQSFQSKIVRTFVSGQLVYDNGQFDESKKGQRLKFEKIR